MPEYTYFRKVVRIPDSMVHYVLCEDMDAQPYYFFVQCPDHIVAKLEETDKGMRVDMEMIGEVVASGAGYLPNSGVRDYLFTAYGMKVDQFLSDAIDF